MHASGALSADQPAAGSPLTTAPGAEALDQDDFYERLAERGYRYGGPFRSLRGIGTDPARPEVVYAEVALPAGTDVTGYGIHPALLDAALHPLASVLDGAGEADSASLRLPYAFSGITLYATAATQLHVQLTRTGEDTFELHATDPTGAPVITINALTLRRCVRSDRPADPDGRGIRQLVRADLAIGARSARAARSLGRPTAGVGGMHRFTRAPAGQPVQTATIHHDLATLTPCPDLVIWPLPRPEDRQEAG